MTMLVNMLSVPKNWAGPFASVSDLPRQFLCRAAESIPCMLSQSQELSRMRFLPPLGPPGAHPDAVLYHGIQAGAFHIVYLHVLHERDTSTPGLHARLESRHCRRFGPHNFRPKTPHAACGCSQVPSIHWSCM